MPKINTENNILNKLLRIGVTILLIAIPLYPKFPIINIPDTYVAIRLEDFLIAIVTLVWLIKYQSKIIGFFQQPITKLIAIFWLIGLISLISALLITQTIEPHIALFHTLRRIEYMIVFLITLSTIKSTIDIKYYLQVIFLTAFLIFVYGLGQKFFQFPIISTMNQEYSKGLALYVMHGGRINSTFAGHYDLAAYTVLLLNIIIVVLVVSKKIIAKLGYLILFITTYWLLLVSSSRISFAAYLGSIIVTLILLKKKLWIIPVVIMSLLTFRFTPSLFNRYSEVFEYEFAPRFAALDIFKFKSSQPSQIALAPTSTPTPKPSIAPTSTGVIPQIQGGIAAIPTPTRGPRQPRWIEEIPPPLEDRSTSIRFNAEWPRAVRAFLKNPLLGTGYSSITLATDNDFLRLLGEVGLLGFLAFGLIFLTLFNKLKSTIFKWPIDQNQALIIGLTGAVIGFFANSVFIDVFEASKVATYFWMLLAIMVGTIGLLPNKSHMKTDKSLN